MTYPCQRSFIQSLLSARKKQLHVASLFNFTSRYIGDLLSIYNPDFESYLGQMYPVELEIKDTTENITSASYLIYLFQSGGTVNFILPFTTNMTIPIFTLKISVPE